MNIDGNEALIFKYMLSKEPDNANIVSISLEFSGLET